MGRSHFGSSFLSFTLVPFLRVAFICSVHSSTMRVCAIAKIVLAALTIALMSGLQGCGCDEDALKKCSLTVTPTGTGATAMADAQKQVCTTASKCIKDADCCDFEKDGSKMKDLVAALCVSGGTNECA